MVVRWLAALGALLSFALPAAAGTCETLAVNLGLTGTTVTGAVTVPGPSFTAPDGVTYTDVPSFCKVSAVLVPTSDSFINVELWMPTASWNGRFEGIGMGLPLSRGLARLHGGDLALDSQVGKGTRATVTLPPERSIEGGHLQAVK